MSGANADLNEALRRAMPVTRMIDYGMQRAHAEAAHAKSMDGGDWDAILSAIADAEEVEAGDLEALGKRTEAAEKWHSAAAALIFAQLRFNFDSARKVELYKRMSADFAQFARRSVLPVERVTMNPGIGEMFGWHFRSAGKPRAAVVVFGGLSGWSTAYRSMAEMLRAEGIDCLLVDGPGQGDSRLLGGVYLTDEAPAGFGHFIDYLEMQLGPVPVGIWGNSFGGLFAALTSVADDRIRACCINGAPARCEVPSFRTPTEQLAAMFGKRDLLGLDDQMRALSFDPSEPIKCPVLVLEGGADPLVPLGAQDAFLVGNSDPRTAKRTWQDGEHTIYNHARERNDFVTQWFASTLR